MHLFISVLSEILLPELLTWSTPLEYSVQTGITALLPSADLCCSLVSSLASLLIDKIAYDFASLRVLGRCGVSFLDGRKFWDNLLFLSSSPPKWICSSFCLLNAVTLFHKCCCILKCMPAPETALSCVALILSLSRSAIVVQGTWEEMWVSWVQCQHCWVNCRGQIWGAIQLILAWLESSPDAGKGI